MATSHLQEPRHRYYNNDGTVAAGGLLYTYEAGKANTADPTYYKATYKDSLGITKHSIPIVLDAKGEALIYWDGSYGVDLKEKDGTQVTGYPVEQFATYLNQADPVIGEIQAPAGTGAYSVTGIGFQPRRLEILSWIDTTLGAQYCQSTVNADGVSVCHNVGAKDATGAQCKSQGNAMISVMNSARTVQFAASFTSYDSDGFTFNITTAYSGAWVRYIAHAR